MNIKRLSIPIQVPKLESLLPRVHLAHPKTAYMQADLARYLKGYRGEKAVSYYLDFLPEKEYYIFHSLRLPSGKYFFQIDYLVLTVRYALILECKNFFGTLYFDEDFKQMIRIANEKEEGFQDISQAKWHLHQLRSFLMSHNITLPIDYFVVISDPSTIVKTSPKNREAMKKVVHGHSLLEKIAEVDRYYKEEIFGMKDLRKVSKLLLKSHTSENFDVLRKYGLKENEILAGVRCPSCTRVPMIRMSRTWHCSGCGLNDKNAHVSAVEDYFRLFGDSITNRQFRDFVGLESEDTAKRLLGALNLPVTGSNKGRKYHKSKE
ncbi:nuclease-related domain-containing protein [Bacillaceae bacterium CLA-AA-H227]|uniref:Nuclease-related domain-containing protein n=1 Tax=Robertmurraya yapensis (ex Hitch et al 2024) TaxID=3133160 RepID=A0ACC6SG95_9BACI